MGHRTLLLVPEDENRPLLLAPQDGTQLPPTGSGGRDTGVSYWYHRIGHRCLLLVPQDGTQDRLTGSTGRDTVTLVPVTVHSIVEGNSSRSPFGVFTSTRLPSSQIVPSSPSAYNQGRRRSRSCHRHEILGRRHRH